MGRDEPFFRACLTLYQGRTLLPFSSACLGRVGWHEYGA
ncbi:hypothetical protein DGo_CA0712 [Deinococcus gobiensis I-0]|uniref:Uncharacterized protein n=1 Tax=Deinococcus gobiensis (strain DSM 21396 / JCM 16679 / CGMCC 1.7299 / I-0) TaxID=745776 RepID=H8GXH9_DEIGI|nr:hypothetical protein DGo_CA0712 [Deinococcus gobiensis I-0]